jgi:rRNA maturation protein Nop10
MKLKKCPSCKIYTQKDICDKCQKKTEDAHYKYIKIRDAPSNQ